MSPFFINYIALWTFNFFLLSIVGPSCALSYDAVVFKPKAEWSIPYSQYGIAHGLQYGVATMQGQRSEQEDRYSINTTFYNHPDHALLSVYDGHLGERASEFARHYLPMAVDRALSRHSNKELLSKKEPTWEKGKVVVDALTDHFLQDTLRQVLHETFLETDQEFLMMANQSQWRDGSTVTTALLARGQLVVANAGDSRGVFYRNGRIIELSRDHKPNRKDEKQRVQDLGGFVRRDNTWRVQGILATSRSIGDLNLKKYIIPNPEFVSVSLQDSECFFILASDGLWDVMDNHEAGVFANRLRHTADLGASQLAREAYRRGSLDNITVLIARAVGPPHTHPMHPMCPVLNSTLPLVQETCPV